MCVKLYVQISFPSLLRFVRFSGHKTEIRAPKGFAPLAQLVEHLTLNQGVPGSSP